MKWKLLVGLFKFLMLNEVLSVVNLLGSGTRVLLPMSKSVSEFVCLVVGSFVSLFCVDVNSVVSVIADVVGVKVVSVDKLIVNVLKSLIHTRHTLIITGTC